MAESVYSIKTVYEMLSGVRLPERIEGKTELYTMYTDKNTDGNVTIRVSIRGIPVFQQEYPLDATLDPLIEDLGAAGLFHFAMMLAVCRVTRISSK